MILFTMLEEIIYCSYLTTPIFNSLKKKMQKNVSVCNKTNNSYEICFTFQWITHCRLLGDPCDG